MVRGLQQVQVQAEAAWTLAQLCPTWKQKGRWNFAGHALPESDLMSSVCSVFLPSRECGKGGKGGLLVAPLHTYHYSFGALLKTKKFHENKRAGKILIWA